MLLLLRLVGEAGSVPETPPVVFYQSGGGQSPRKRKPRLVVPDWLDKLKIEAPVVEPVMAETPKPFVANVTALKAVADAAEARAARLEAQVTAAKRERTVARLKTDHAAALVALKDAKQAEWRAILRDEDELFLMAA